MDTEDRYTGCLIGEAAGDALGFAVEFDRTATIHKRFGPDGITEYRLNDGLARISDDTQMTLFTAEGLLSAEGNTMEAYVESIRQCYLAWYRTQTLPAPAEDEPNPLARLQGLYARRAPGTTCLNAIRDGANGSIESPVNDSKGCGGVMRVAPIGLFFAQQEEHTIEWVDMLAARAAALTHGHPLGYISAAGLAHIICEVLREPGTSLEAIVVQMCQTMNTLFASSASAPKLVRLVQQAVQLAAESVSDAAAIRHLGEGWVGEEALAIAVFCALRHQDNFDLALRAAVNHDGDSDSTGAIAGSILGTVLGIGAIPLKYKDHLEFAAVLLDTASALYEAG